MQKIIDKHKSGGLGAERASSVEKIKLKRKTDYAESIRQNHKANIKIPHEPQKKLGYLIFNTKYRKFLELKKSV